MLQFTFMQRRLVAEQSPPNIVNTQHPPNIPPRPGKLGPTRQGPRNKQLLNTKQPGQLAPAGGALS